VVGFGVEWQDLALRAKIFRKQNAIEKYEYLCKRLYYDTMEALKQIVEFKSSPELLEKLY